MPSMPFVIACYYGQHVAQANWDFIVASRSRPRPSQLHPHATGDTADEVLGTRSADTIDAGDVSHAAAVEVVDATQQNPQQQLCRKLDVSYALVMHLTERCSSPLDIIHRHSAAASMDARSGDTFRNVEQLLNAHRKAYKALQNPRAIDAKNVLKNHSAKEVKIQDEVNAVA